MSANAGIDQMSALAGVPLTRGKTGAQSLTTGATYAMDVPCGGTDFVTVEGEIAAAGAAGDCTVQVFPYMADGVTLMATPLPAVTGIGYVGTLASAKSQLVQQYNVQGIDKVQVVWKNNNAGTKTLNGSWRTASW